MINYADDFLVCGSSPTCAIGLVDPLDHPRAIRVSHSEPVTRYFLSPDMARELAVHLTALADELEARS